MSEAPPSSSITLVPLPIALQPYRGVTVRMGRARIREGVLPAAKIGRAYFVDPRDVARVFAPTLRAPAKAAAPKDGPRVRADRQLTSAGFRTP